MEHNIVPSQAEEIQHLSVFATPKFSLDDENLTLSDVEDYYDDINGAEEEETAELRAGDVVVFYRMAAHGVPDQMAWAQVTSIKTYHDEDDDIKAHVGLSTYDTIDYDHNKVAVYRHDAHGVLRDVTGLKLFRSMEDLTLIDGEMMHGTYVTDGHRVRTIMTRQHMAMNERMVQQGIINNVDDGVQCVDTPTPDIHATTLVDYEVLSRVMDKVMKQITARSKYSSELRDKLTKKRYEKEQPLEEENEQMDVEVEEREEDQTNTVTVAAAASVRLSY